MAPNPLRGAASFLLTALLAAPSFGMDVKVPTEVGNTGAPGQAGAVGGMTPGVNGGVSAVPNLGLGLAPSLGAAMAPAPQAPSALQVGVQQAAATPVPNSQPGVAAATAKPAPAGLTTGKIFGNLLKGTPPAPPAIDAPSHSPASAGEIDAKLVKGAKISASGAISSREDLQALYDGAGEKGALGDEVAPEKLAALLALGMDGAPRASGLAPAGRAAPGFKMEPPTPKGSKAAALSNWMSGTLEAFSGATAGLWGSVVSALPGSGSKTGESALSVLPFKGKKQPEVGERIEVRGSRGVYYDALGYRVLYAPPAAQGLRTAKTVDRGVSVRLERGEEASETAALRERFAHFNGLIESNFAALELIAQSSSKMTVKTARAVHAHVSAMAQSYAALGEGDAGREADALGVKLEVQRLGSQIEQAVKGLADSDLLPPAAVELVMPIDKRALHKYLNYLHQQALEAVGRTNAAAPANLTVRLGAGASEKSVSLVDLSENPLVKNSRVVSPGFNALLAAMTRSIDTPKGSLIMQDHQFWGHFRLGAHSAEVYANFLSPDEGGMIRVRYQEWGTGYDNQTRLYYVGRLLHKAGFHVDQKNGFLTAVIDKDHASQTVEEMTDTFALIVQALHATVGVDFALPMLVKGAKTSEEVGRRIDDWVDTVLGEGTLPFYVHDDHAAMVSGWKKYSGDQRARAVLRAALDKNLTALGLPPIPAEERLGQRTIDRFVNEPIEAAIARDELIINSGGKLVRSLSYDPLSKLAANFSDGGVAPARMAEVVSSLDPALFRYETIGALGGLSVERAQRRFDPDAWVTVYALRDPKSGQIGLARAEISHLRPGQRAKSMSPDALFGALKAQGHPVAEFEPAAMPPGFGYFQKIMQKGSPSDDSAGRRFQGVAASPGHGRPVLARVTFDKAKAAEGGFVFVAPYTTPDDLDAIRASKAVITTSGGLLSHAAITTREMGIPAAILPGVDWNDGAASLNTFVLGEPYKAGALLARRAKAAAPVRLSEGEVVRLDPATGVVETFPAGTSAPLLDAHKALEKLDAAGGNADLAAWIEARITSPILRDEQKEVFLREVLGGLFDRALADDSRARAFGRSLSVVPGPQEPIGAVALEAIDRRFKSELANAAQDLRERRELVDESLSSESIERLWREADRRARGLRALASELARPKTELASFEVALESLREEARGRHEQLIARELAELQTHARLFPAATVEALPRIKAAIAKARRRNLSPELIRRWEEQAARLESTRRQSMEASAPAVLPLSTILDVDVPWVGGKAAKLGEIASVVRAAGGEMTPGIALTVHAYRRFLREAGIAEKLEAIGADKRLTPEQRSEYARRLILSAPLYATGGVGLEILRGLAAQRLAETPLAVRSSAVDEDGAEAAFAGAGDTHLYVEPAEVLEHVKDVWASLWNPRALLYRETRGLSTQNLAQAVVIQAMVDSEVSGVAFTQDPVSGSSGRVIVNAAFGLGEGIVSGRVAPDQYVLAKTSGRELLPAMISDKKLAIVRGKDGKGTVDHKMPAEWRRRRSMTPAKLKLLTDVSVALERHFGYALDIEFGFVGDKLYILQSRAVTTSEPAAPAVPAPPTGSQMKPAQAAKPKRLMFVCTGNTCRSPMAAHLARERLSRRGRPDIEVVSRGLSVAAVGQQMNPQALATLGLPASEHRSLPLTADDVAGTTLILTMTADQARAVRARYPQAEGKVFSLAEYTKRGGDVADPYGGDADAYRAAALEIGDALDVFVAKVQPGKVAESSR